MLRPSDTSVACLNRFTIPPLGSTQPAIQGVPTDLSPDVKLNIHPNLAMRFRISGCVPLVPLAFTPCAGTALPLLSDKRNWENPHISEDSRSPRITTNPGRYRIRIPFCKNRVIWCSHLHVSLLYCIGAEINSPLLSCSLPTKQIFTVGECLSVHRKYSRKRGGGGWYEF